MAAMAVLSMATFARTANAQSDSCAGATAVFTGANAAGNNCGTVDPDEVEVSCQSNSNHDVYFTWTADCTGNATIDTEGSVFTTSNDTVLTIFDSCGGSEIACDDDGGSGALSTLTFACTSGTTYVIRVAGWNTHCGDISLNIACAAAGAGACCMGDGTCTDVSGGMTECDGLGGTYQGDFTNCATTICPGPCTTCTSPTALPYSENFEAGFGLWTQNGLDDADWTRDSGGTPSTGTGPSVDHTLGTSAGFYLFTEATGFAVGDRYVLDGPCFDLTTAATPQMSFWYHMLNTSAVGDMGTLTVEISTDNCLNYTPLFSMTGNQGDVWLNGVIDLSAYAGQLVNIRFVGTRGNDFESDMAIDDIVVLDTSAAVTGACCFLDGSCMDLDATACGTAGGTYRGDLTSCASGICSGACCLDNNGCENTSEASCTVAGGLYLGDTTQCGIDACPPAGDICATAIVVGSGTTVVTNVGNLLDDPDPTCTSSGELDVWAVYTVEQNGSLLITTCGTRLDPGNPTAMDTILAAYDGACGGPSLDCDDDCAGTTDPSQAICHDEAQAGTATRDSCLCIDSVTIGQLIYIQIQDFSNVEGNITLNIIPDGCPPPTGRCCLADGSCTIVSDADCTNMGGIYGGDGVDCSVSCFGACCLPANGGCVSETEASCANAGGSYGGDTSECFAFDINTGLSNGGVICEGSCTDIVVLRNSTATSSSIDITFDNNLATADGLPGSCTGGGTNMQNDAYFRYLAISDTNGPCDVSITVTPTGYDATLVVRSACDGAELACSEVGGVGGVESVIVPSFGPGLLFIQVGDFGTTEGGGLTQLEVNCSTATGACCMGGNCSILTAGDCSLAGGVYKGDNTDCLTACFGACCAANGSCSSLTEVSCNADGGTYQGDGSSCTPNPCPQPPANDDCANAIEVFTGANNGGNNCLASATDDAEASCQTNSGRDVWFFWTATCTGEATIDTEGSVFTTSNDTVLSVWDACGGTELACDDDDGTGLLSTLTLSVTQGVDYYIRVAGFNTNCGDINLNIACVALCGTCPGDMNGDSLLDGRDIQAFTDCYLAEFGTDPSAACKCADVNVDSILDANDITDFVDLLLNGGGICNPGACCYLDGGSAACTVTDAAGCALLSGAFTLGADCTGDPCPAGRCCSNNGLTCDDIPELECAALGGAWSAGLDCLGSPCPVTPANDECGGAIAVFDGSTPIDLTNATTSAGAACGDFPFGTDVVNADLWYSYVASCDGLLFVDTCGDADDTRLAIYDVDCAAIAGGALPIECNDDHGNASENDSGNACADTLSASLSVPVSSGATYIIRVGSFSAPPQTLMFPLNIACVPGGNGACCLGDGACVNVTGGVLECDGFGGTYQGDGTDCLTTICGGACCLANGSCVDAATASDCVDNIGGAYQGNGTECATTSCPQPAPANDNCVDAIAVVTGVNILGNNCGASGTDDKEASCQSNSGLDVYYVWTADCTGQATIDTEGSLFSPSNDTVLTVYETSCGAPELVCDDDDGTGLLSTVSFPCVSGVDYVIRVAGFGANCGEITLNIACVSGGACCVGTGCTSAADQNDCEVNLGGIYQGDFTDCGSVVCGGACCLANGSCAQAVDASDCIDNLSGTIYYGDGTQCTDPFVICPGPGECLHTLNLFDSFGDGWNGGAIEVFVNGVSVFGGAVTFGGGSSASGFFSAGTGDTITTTMTSGGFPAEESWEILDGGGAMICSDGPTPDNTPMRSCGSGNCP